MKHRFAGVVSLALCGAIMLTGCTAEDSSSAPSSTSAPAASATPGPAFTVPSGGTSASTQAPVSDENTLVIGEKLFIMQINEMYYNIENYEDKTIVVEGMYGIFKDEATYPSGVPIVFRYGPGCCANDGWGGFFLHYDGEPPKENDWIRVTGKPEIVINGYYHDLYLNVTSLEVLTERGAETVTQ